MIRRADRRRDALSRAFQPRAHYTKPMSTANADTAEPAPEEATSIARRRAISVWLFAMCALVALMVVVGGATRLTDSGLSITEWKPVTGVAPPLTAEAWEAEFAKYRAIPEYRIVNEGMSLAEFKTIYWWEWGHRMLGRVIGIAFLAPLIVFGVRGWLDRALGLRLFGIFLLGGLQGALGWYMVMSGLTERVDVSQYRLAAHLGLAVLLFSAMLWLALDLRRGDARPLALRGVGLGAALLALGVYGQIILGAFVAGLRAGKSYTTWPLMDGAFFPGAYFNDAPAFADAFETAAAVQFNHRLGAYVLAAGGLWLFAAARGGPLQARARIVAAAILAQMVLGIATVTSATPIALGLAHQIGALFVLGAAIYTVHGSRTSMSIARPSSPDGAAISRGLIGNPTG